MVILFIISSLAGEEGWGGRVMGACQTYKCYAEFHRRNWFVGEDRLLLGGEKNNPHNVKVLTNKCSD